MYKKYFHSYIDACQYIKNNGLLIVKPFKSIVQLAHCNKTKVWSVLAENDYA